MQTLPGLEAAATVEIRPDGSPVTAVDCTLEAVLSRSIERARPGRGIAGEE